MGQDPGPDANRTIVQQQRKFLVGHGSIVGGSGK